jgi:mannitol/fructose-specific phosphotransferase system IIA component
MTHSADVPVVEAILNRSFGSRREVIDAIGAALLGSSSVTPAYVEGMHRKEEQGGTIVTAEVALPHGTRDVQHAVLRNAVVIVPIPGGVEWTPGRHVRLAIGFSGTGDQAHLRVIAALARALSDDRLVSRLKTATEPRDVAGLVEHLVGFPSRLSTP